MDSRLSTAIVFGAALLLGGCARGPKTAEAAFLQLELAVAAGKTDQIMRCLDDKTVRALKGAWQDERLARSLAEAKLAGAERAAWLSRFAAAQADDFEKYFHARATEWGSVERYRVRLGSVSGPILHKPDGSSSEWVHRQDGMPFHFTRGEGGVWGFDEMLKVAVLMQDQAARAVQSLREQVQNSHKGNP